MPPTQSVASTSIEIEASSRPPALRALGRSVLNLFTHRATVSDVQTLSATMRLISLRSEAFSRIEGAPGDKIQIQVAGMTFRTYTPLRLGGDEQELHVVGFERGEGPGSAWVGRTESGDRCQVIGPRRSLGFKAMPGPFVFFGDETSIGLARALSIRPQGEPEPQFIFETSDAAALRMALGAGVMRSAWLLERRDDERHLDDVASTLARRAAAEPACRFVFTGRAPALQRVTRSLKAAGVPPSHFLVKAHWAPGKKGMD